MKFTYTIDLDERGEFRLHVDNEFGITVFELHSEDAEISLVEDGFMRHGRDTEGLLDYLVDCGIASTGDTIALCDAHP